MNIYLVKVRLFHFEEEQEKMTSSFFEEKMVAGKDDHMTLMNIHKIQNTPRVLRIPVSQRKLFYTCCLLLLCARALCSVLCALAAGKYKHVFARSVRCKPYTFKSETLTIHHANQISACPIVPFDYDSSGFYSDK